MNEEIDFNVDNYDIDELIQLLDFDTMPTNGDIIVNKINKLKRKYKDKEKYIKFFNSVGKKLLLGFDNFNKATWINQYENDETLSAKVLKQQYVDFKNDEKNLILNPNKDIIGVKKLSTEKTFATKSTIQGTKNPVEINRIRRIVNFDSQYREMLNPISDNCRDENGNFTINNVNTEIRLYSPTNYTINLNQPLTNVIDISLDSVEIPNTWYVFSKDYGTNSIEFEYFDVLKSDIQLTIDPALYPTYTLVIETVSGAPATATSDTEIGLRDSDTKAYVSFNDDATGLFSRLTIPSTDLADNKLYELWVGEYNTTFLDGSDPFVSFSGGGGPNTNYIVNIYVLDNSTAPLPGYPIVLNGTISENGVDLFRTISINPLIVSADKQIKKITIDEGNYTPTQLITEINSRLTGIPTLFSLNTRSGKVSIINENPTKELVVNFYIDDAESSGCTAQKTLGEEGTRTPSPGNKVGYNLGWLLGYRVKSLVISNNSFSTATGQVDTFGPRYFFLTLDDFNNNKPNKDLISVVGNTSKNFKFPKYYNPQTMDKRYGVQRDSLGNIISNTYYPGHSQFDADAEDWKCVDAAGDPAERGCAENDLNIDLSSNLTKKQQYTVEQITIANSSGRTIELASGQTISTVINRYTSPNSSDLLAKIPIDRGRLDLDNTIIYRNNDPEYTKRIYFGPVKLRKFKIKLLNDKGFEVNLNDHDWSFSIFVTQLYQF